MLTSSTIEYIGQLEGEVAAKTNEANDLRVRNRALAEENSRLTDLTRMLLSSSHFSSFLNDISMNGLPPPPLQQTPASQAPVQSNPPKDANPNLANQDVQMQQDPQVGMALIPEQGVDYGSNTGLDMNNTGWNTGIDMNFTNAQVFAVMDVPEGPPIDTSIISGKSSNTVGPCESDESKEHVPPIERPTPAEDKTEKAFGKPVPEIEIDESDPAFALFIDQPDTSTTAEETSTESTIEPFEDLFGGVVPEKVFARIDLLVDDGSNDVGRAAVHRFDRLCTSMEAAFQRISNVTSHL